ncbi:MAG: AbrB/MazE/SpoVT family DNA-binding domain-containing protein [bacterium]|nr:AbrB/MazE/SpoVT family DNA-binding domain-containing protein [bacterium]
MTTVQKWGNSLAVRIPKDVAERYQLSVGKPLELIQRGDEIILRPTRLKIPSLAELVKGITKKNRHKLIFPEDAPRGKEVW